MEVGAAASVRPKPPNQLPSMVPTGVALTACATALVSAGVAVLAMKSAASTWTDAAETVSAISSTPSEGLNCRARRWRTASTSKVVTSPTKVKTACTTSV